MNVYPCLRMSNYKVNNSNGDIYYLTSARHCIQIQGSSPLIFTTVNSCIIPLESKRPRIEPRLE